MEREAPWRICFSCARHLLEESSGDATIVLLRADGVIRKTAAADACSLALGRRINARNANNDDSHSLLDWPRNSGTRFDASYDVSPNFARLSLPTIELQHLIGRAGVDHGSFLGLPDEQLCPRQLHWQRRLSTTSRAPSSWDRMSHALVW
jgi:hypothetical protein